MARASGADAVWAMNGPRQAFAIPATCNNLDVADEVSERGGLTPQPASSIPLATRELAELLAERLDLAVGTCRLELQLQDGALVHVWAHAKLKASSL
jgi:hypothetical protein